MAIQRFNAVGGYSTGITATAVIDAIGNITGVSGSFSGYVSGSTGFLFGPTSAFLQFIPTTSAVNGGMWLKNGLFQIGGSVIGSGIGAVDYSPNNERFHVFGYADFNNSYNYQAGRAALRVNGAPTQSVPIFAAYKQTSDGAQLAAGFVSTNMVAGIDQNGALFSTAGISAAGGVTFAGTVASDTGYRITSNAIKALTGTTYTFIAADNGDIVTFNNGSTITVTVPTGLPVGFNCTAIQLGTGAVGFTAASGVTLNAYSSAYKIAGQHGSASLISYATNIFNLSGSLNP